MEWLIQLISGESVAHSVYLLSVVTAFGLALGSIRVYGINLGIAGVLFSGLLLGHFGLTINPHVMEFAREFGLILFVYTIGMQVGPGFMASLRRQGLRLNMLALAIVVLGVAIAVGVSRYGGVQLPVAVGLLAGGVTNTPSLAAAQQTLKETPGVTEEVLKMPGLGYAIAYPFGILGIILSMLLIRFFFKIKLQDELDAVGKHLGKPRPLRSVQLEVTNPNLNGIAIQDIPYFETFDIVISRILHDGKVQIVQPETLIHPGDTLLVVGQEEPLEKFEVLVGKKSSIDLRALSRDITTRRIVLTRKAATGQTVEELDLQGRFGVAITRIKRSEIEIPATDDMRFQYGDVVTVVGEPNALQKVATELGDSPKQLDHPQLIPIFVGIALGVFIGSWPIYFPGMPAPVKLGLAGGPLLVAILLSRVGSVGGLIWYMPASANFMLREIGVTLFLACVGLKSGDRFVETLVAGDGLRWMAMASMITLLPLVIVGFAARLIWKLDYYSICGLLAGGMTDPPALAFANTTTRSDLPAISYATVYPLTMILRILSAQILLLLFR